MHVMDFLTYNNNPKHRSWSAVQRNGQHERGCAPVCQQSRLFWRSLGLTVASVLALSMLPSCKTAQSASASKDTSRSSTDTAGRALLNQVKKLENDAKAAVGSLKNQADSIVNIYKGKAEAELKKLDEKSKEVEADVNAVLADAQDAARDVDDFMKKIGRTLNPANIKLFSDTSSVGQAVNDFTAYFNTYYNAQRLMIITEDEFAFQDEKKRVKPRIVILEPHTLQDDAPDRSELPAFLEAFVITPERLQPVREPVDSILIKGSKILSKHGKSKYVDGTLFLMAKAFFFKQEWFPAQVKCEELIKNYPYSYYSPDAHLLMAKSLLMQLRFPDGNNALSKTVDIAWGQKRYDILSEAFKIQADLALYLDKPDEATKPYRRAVAQADDPVQQARWQVDLGVLLYRLQQFTAAERELSRIATLAAADALAVFEAQLYRAASLARLKRFASSDSLLTTLEANRAFTDWRPWIYAERMNLFRQTETQGSQGSLDSMNMVADTVISETLPIAAANYQRGVWEFKRGNEKQAQLQFQKSLIERAPNYNRAKQYSELMKRIEPLAAELDKVQNIIRNDSIANLPSTHRRDSLSLAASTASPSMTTTGTMTRATSSTLSPTLLAMAFAIRDSLSTARAAADSVKAASAMALFLIGRANERLGRPDSARELYRKASRVCAITDTTRARYLHAEARLTGFGEKRSSFARKRSDSVLADIVRLYPRTQFAADARVRIGVAETVLDSAELLFSKAESVRNQGVTKQTTQQFASLAGQIVSQYPRSGYAPRSLYMTGWMFEQQRQRDSAIGYYTQLLKRYPASNYAQDVKPIVEEISAFRIRERIRLDSLRFVDSMAAVIRADSIRAYREVQQELELERIKSGKQNESKPEAKQPEAKQKDENQRDEKLNETKTKPDGKPDGKPVSKPEPTTPPTQATPLTPLKKEQRPSPR
jgi:outer membrane protein assembly factor BamD (BamD/ComL family)